MPFYPEIEKFMSSRPVVVMALQGQSVVCRVRDLLGPTDSRKAAKGTIRGDFGTEMMRNVVHASDSVGECEDRAGPVLPTGRDLQRLGNRDLVDRSRGGIWRICLRAFGRPSRHFVRSA